MINRLRPSFSIRIHLLFWFILTGAVVTGQFVQVITLFVIVLIHELGHIIVARRFGWDVVELTLLPFGGVAKMNPSSRENPWEEFWIAVAGPISNGVMILCALLFYLLKIWFWEWTLFFIVGNATIGSFNLLPIYPLDGGRIFQVFLSFYLPFRKAILFSLFLGGLIALSILILSFYQLQLGLQLWFVLPYLIYMIYVEYQRLPFRFLSFLLSRHLRTNRFAPLETAYIPVSPTLSLKAGTERMYRHRYHFFCIEGNWEYQGEQSYIEGERSRFDKKEYYGEHRILAEIFEAKRPLSSFAEFQERAKK